MRLFRHLGLVLVGILIGAALAYLDFAKQPAEFESTAIITMRNADAGTIPVAPSGAGPLTSPYDELLRSNLVIERALANGELRSLTWLRDTADPAAILRERLDVRRLDPAGLTTEVKFIALRPEDPPRVLNSLLAECRRVLSGDVEEGGAETLELIRRSRDELLEQIRRKEKSLAEFRTSSAADWPGREAFARKRSEFEELQGRQASLKATLVELRSQLAAVESAPRNDEPPTPGPAKSTATAPVPASGAEQTPPLGAALGELLAEEAKLLKSYGRQHPKVKSVRARIDAIPPDLGVETAVSRLQAEEKLLLESYGPEHPKVRAVRVQLAALSAAASDGLPTTTPAPPRRTSPPVDQAGALRDEIALRDKKLAELEQALAVMRGEIGKLEIWDQNEAILERDLDRTRRLYEAAVLRLREMSPPAGSPRFTVLSAPELGRRIERSPVRTLAMGMGSGAAVGLALSWLKARAVEKRRVHSALEAETVPLLAHLSDLQIEAHFAADRDRFPENLIVYQHPQSAVAEAYRSLRTIVHFRSTQVARRHIGLFEASGGDAASIIAANLAASFALAGRKTLLVDCGGHRPAAAFNVETHPIPLGDALAGRAEPADALVPTSIPELDTARWEAGIADPEVVSRRSTLAALREKYDFTVVSLPSQADGNFVAALELIDAVIVVAPSTTDDTELAMALERTTELRQCPVLGKVVYETSRTA